MNCGLQPQLDVTSGSNMFIQAMNTWALHWLILTLVISKIQVSDGNIWSRSSDIPEEVTRKSDGINSSFGDRNACRECKNLLGSIRNQIEGNHTADTIRLKPEDSLQRFCISYLLPMVEDNTDTCGTIVNYFLSKIQNGTTSSAPRDADLCDASGVCGVIDQRTTVSDMQEFPSVKFHDPNTKSMESQKMLSWPMSNRLVETGFGVIDRIRKAFGRSDRRSSSSPVTFVQISDIHLDAHYEQGSATTCLDKICCRRKTKGSGSAGRFGDYRCDSVKETVDTLLASIAQLSPPPDFFIYVGDSPPHSVRRAETLDKKLEDNKAVNDILREKLRGIGPIYPTLGNHDMFPENVYFSKGKHTKIILEELSVEWGGLFPLSADQKQNVQEHGFYTTLIRDGLRIISMNSLYAYRLNPLAILFALDSASRHQYRLIRKTLDDARSKNEKVIIMSHMKPSHINTYALYTNTMERLVKEYQGTIILMLYGHEHTDTFVLSTDPLNRKKATGAFLAAPSISPYIYYQLGTNPAYRVFSLDRSTLQPLDYEQYYVDLQQANDNNELIVKKHYRFTEEYNVLDLSPESFKTITDRITDDWGYYKKFERNKDVLVRRRKQCQRWNRYCRRKLTCETTAPTKRRFTSCLLNPFI